MSRSRNPVWRRIQSELEFEIRANLLAPGDQLPSEHELAERFDVNRHTVRVALANLAVLGLVRARRGRGVFVEDRPPEYRITRDSKWSEIERQMNALPSGRLVDTSRRPVSPVIANLLALEPGAELLILETVRGGSQGLQIYGYHAFAAARFEGIEKAFARTGSYTTALAEFDVKRFFRASTWIDCRMPRVREAETLAIPLDAPVLVMMYVDNDEQGAPLLYGSAIIPNGSMVVRVDTI